jgi:hypothetical protein
MNEPSSDLDALAHAVIGAAIEVHSVLGAGFLESTYEQALAIELALRRIPFQRQWPISLSYKGQSVGDARVSTSWWTIGSLSNSKLLRWFTQSTTHK